jgi:predicted AlkP superfamily pyrophosphatase or phosphodiesterase
MVTGLYPESHGILGDRMWDPIQGQLFDRHDANAQRDSIWWKGEPIWITATSQVLFCTKSFQFRTLPLLFTFGPVLKQELII